MIRFAVLNEEELSRSKDEESVEIQAEKCLGLYESAIRQLQNGQLKESQRMLKNLIDSDLLQKIDNDAEIAAHGTPLRRLQYLVYTNYAYILEQVEDNASALQFYLKAIAFDNSDVSLWAKIGTLAASEKKFKLARYALECGLQQPRPEGSNGSAGDSIFTGTLTEQDLTPSQWTCLETLCEVLYDIGDYTACEDYIQRALRVSPYFQRGLELQGLIRSRLQDKQDQNDIFCNVLDGPIETKFSSSVKEVLLDDPSWLNLGEQLLEEYRALRADPEKEFYNRRLVITAKKIHNEDTGMDEDPVGNESSATLEGETVMEEAVLSEAKAASESAAQDPAEPSVSIPACSEETVDPGDKEGTETEQSAAIKRKKKELEERSGLRTSKRVRDKREQFEETKRKREEEEQELLAKYRIVLSKFGMDIENGHISGSSPDALKSEDIFPNGISGLLAIFNRHLERPNALVHASTIEHVQQMNEQNSGVVEYLCEFVLVVLAGLTSLDSEPNWQKRWPSGLRTVVITIISIIEDHLHEYLNQETQLDALDNELEQRIKLELQLSICEMYLDEMVHAILHPFTIIARKGKGTRKVDAEHVSKLDRQFQRWSYLAGLGVEIPLRNFTWKSADTYMMPWIRAAALRFKWMLGRHAQCLGHAADAISRFEDCVQELKGDSSLVILMPNCKYDATVDIERIQERLSRLKMHQYVLDSARLFDERDYNAVITRLEPIFLRKGEGHRGSPLVREERVESNIADTIGGSLSEKLELMGLLYKSCEGLEDRLRQFHCITEMFVLVVETLVNTITDKSEASEAWFLFGQVCQKLYLLRETLQSTSLLNLLHSLEDRLLQRLVCCALAVARLGFVNVLHQDRLVDDDIKLSYSDLLKNRPHLEQFNLILMRSWLVLLLLIPGWIRKESEDDLQGVGKLMPEPLPLNTIPLDMKAMDLDPETVQRVLSRPLTSNSTSNLGVYICPSQGLYMELIALVHDDLGIREICGIDNNELIKLALKVSSPMQGAFYRKEENQCYYCFYGISLSVDGQYPIEHSSEPVDFDQKAAVEFFPLLQRSLSDKVLRGQVRSDIKDAVDRLEEALGSPPYESNSILEMNRQLIDGYLASEINFADAIQINSKNQLPTMPQPPSSKLPSVYGRIYAIHGKIFLAQFRNKAKNNQFKPLEDLQHAIDQFKTDIHVNPDCWDSWYSLATCYAFLADENLVFSALDIKNNFSKITDLQKRAFHCFSQAVRLAPKRTSRIQDNDSISREAESQASNDMGSSWNDSSQQNNDQERAPSEDRESLKSEEINDKQKHTDRDRDKDRDRDTDIDQEWYQRQASFWFDFGNLVHGIMSKPMRMEAMRRTGGLESISEVGEPVMVPVAEPTEEQVYKFAAFCFKRSLMLNDQNWRTPFMLGKCIEKLNGKPSQVLAMYKMAADKVPYRSGQPGNEKIFEASYKIISTLSKYLTDNKIKASVVESLMSKTLAKSKLSATDGESFIFEPPKEYLQVIQSDPPSEQDIQKKEKLHAFRLLCEGLARIRHTDKRHWHHRPVFRQAWILYHIYHDVERAKTEMLSLFQIKSNIKTLVSSVWKPEFERSGKHFIYVGEYTKFLIVLAKETNDVETLNSLARKIRRANGLLLDLKEIWELLYESYLAVLAALVGPPPMIAVAEVIPRTEFREKAAIYEARMFEQAATLPGLTVLQRLCELKKLNDKMAPEGQIGHLLAVCYSKLFIEVGGGELYPKELVRQLSNNMEPYATPNDGSESNDAGAAEGSARDIMGNGSVSTKRALVADMEDDQEGARLKMAKLTSGAQASGNILSQSQATSAPNGSLPAIVIDGTEVKDGEQGEAEERSTAPDLTLINNNGDATASRDAPSSPALSPHTKDVDTTSAMDVEPDMEDWKNRKKISAAELASRATVMCKAPPPSLKAPQSLQSKLAGPDSQAAQEDASMVGPSDETGDVVMELADKADKAVKMDPSRTVKTEANDGALASSLKYPEEGEDKPNGSETEIGDSRAEGNE
ncbi:Histone transcription regulator 3 [Modicella reniformis]|uniref:Histone transcription regulator 3 n=1 Tax=Modicella reniformis TaxID=1440133 RepID=A0A9P6J5P4_9FUNG|nr:Histone transcription regulator 3 [Modicella reniformis]